MCIVLLLLTIIGCTPKITVFPDVPLKPISEYRYFQEQEGLVIVIEPFLEVENVIRYFGTDLLSKGILPVFVLAENHHLESGFLLVKTSIYLLKQDGVGDSETSATTDRQPIRSYSQERIELEKTSGNLFIATTLFPIFIIPGIITGDRIANADSIIENLEKKEFIDKTIFPNRNNSGFIYFQMKDKDEIKKISYIVIKGKLLLLDKEITFNFKLE